MPKKGDYIKFKNYERKLKSPFMINVDFETVLVPKDNGKQKSRRIPYKQISITYWLQLWLQISMC